MGWRYHARRRLARAVSDVSIPAPGPQDGRYIPQRRTIPLSRVIIAPFAFRTIGQALFVLTGDELVFLPFPKVLEPRFLAYAAIVLLRHRDQPGRR